MPPKSYCSNGGRKRQHLPLHQLDRYSPSNHLLFEEYLSETYMISKLASYSGDEPRYPLLRTEDNWTLSLGHNGGGFVYSKRGGTPLKLVSYVWVPPSMEPVRLLTLMTDTCAANGGN